MSHEQQSFFGDDQSHGALFDETRTYRYRLWRRWGHGPAIVWIMLNPSTADESILDPTLRRCLDYSKRWGYPAMEILNVYGYRSTDPSALRQIDDPVGKDNLRHIEDVVKESAIVLVGWGVHARPEAVDPVLEILARHGKPPHCLRVTAEQHPGHPLYLPKGLEPTLWAP